MLGDIIRIKPAYQKTAAAILDHIKLTRLIGENSRLVIAIGGESGSGKSVTAVCVAQLLNERGIPATILHQDDYFHLPPLDNHRRRREGLEWVGPQEVKLDLLQQHLELFREGALTLTKPLSDYSNNKILEETIEIGAYRVVIAEGTYAMMLEPVHYRIFMERNYRETQEQRQERARDTIDEFGEKILEIEHQFIAPGITRADAVVGKDYSVRF